MIEAKEKEKERGSRRDKYSLSREAKNRNRDAGDHEETDVKADRKRKGKHVPLTLYSSLVEKGGMDMSLRTVLHQLHIPTYLFT